MQDHKTPKRQWSLTIHSYQTALLLFLLICIGFSFVDLIKIYLSIVWLKIIYG
jgi:hypothetical protein